MPGGNRFRPGQEAPSVLLSSTANASDEAVDFSSDCSPSPEVKEALSFCGQLEPAFSLNRSARVGLTRERRIRTDSVDSPGNRRIIDRNGEASIAGTLCVHRGHIVVSRSRTSLRGHACPCPDLIHDREGAGQVIGFDFGFGQPQKQVRVPVYVDVQRALLLRLPTDSGLRSAGLFMNRFLGAVRASVRRVSDERSVIESPILVGDELASNGPVEARVYGRQVARLEI